MGKIAEIHAVVIKATFFAAEARIYLKGVLIKFHFVPFWGWGVRLDFLSKAEMLYSLA